MTPPDTPLKPSARSKRACSPPEEPSTPPKRTRTTARNTFRVPSSSASSASTASSATAPDADQPPAESVTSDCPIPTLYPPVFLCGNSITISTFGPNDVLSPVCAYDGQIALVRVQGNVYSLSRSKLADLCARFRELFSPNADKGWNTWVWSFVKMPVYEVPGISIEDFERFLEVLEKFAHIPEPLPEDMAVSLLRVAHALACDSILTIAKKRLNELWDGSQLPHPDEPVRDPVDAVKAVNLARQYNLPGMLKRAVYELLGNKTFRDILLAHPYETGLHHEDITLLFQIRLGLSSAWQTFVLTAPCTDPRTRISMCDHATGKDCTLTRTVVGVENPPKGRDRVSCWEHVVIQTGQLQKGADDPLRHDWIRENDALLEKSWCQDCLRERRSAWEEARREWWAMLDAWLIPS